MVCLAIALGMYLSRGTVFYYLACGLITAGSFQSADAVLVLDGDGCFEEAARLYHQGEVQKALLIKYRTNRLVQLGIVPPPESLARNELEKLGVPASAIELIGNDVKSNWDAARAARDRVDGKDESRLVVLCSEFGSRETRWIYSKVLDRDQASRVRLKPLRDRRYDEFNWWHSKQGVLAVFNSYVGLAYSWTNGEQPDQRQEFDAEDWLRNELGSELHLREFNEE